MATATDASELLAQIIASPEEDALRVVYADLLQEQGDVRGELIQLQCERARRALRPEEETRLEALLEKHAPAWLGVRKKAIEECRWERGFVVAGRLRAQRGRGTLTFNADDIEAAALHPEWPLLRSLDLRLVSGAAFESEEIRAEKALLIAAMLGLSPMRHVNILTGIAPFVAQALLRAAEEGQSHLRDSVEQLELAFGPSYGEARNVALFAASFAHKNPMRGLKRVALGEAVSVPDAALLVSTEVCASVPTFLPRHSLNMIERWIAEMATRGAKIRDSAVREIVFGNRKTTEVALVRNEAGAWSTLEIRRAGEAQLSGFQALFEGLRPDHSINLVFSDAVSPEWQLRLAGALARPRGRRA